MNESTDMVTYDPRAGEVYDVGYTEVVEPPPKGWPWTVWAGLVVMVAATALLAVDVVMRGGESVGRTVLDAGELAAPDELLWVVGRWVAVHFCPIIWVGLLLFLEGLTTRQAWRRGDRLGGPVRARPWLFTFAGLSGVIVWCLWDLLNFYILGSWMYLGLPELAGERYVGYFIAFAAISPEMFMIAHLFQKMGLEEYRTRLRVPLSPALAMVMLLLGAAMLALPFVWAEKIPVWREHQPYTTKQVVAMFAMNAGIWIAPILILDPINVVQKRPSLLQDWGAGRWGRTLSLMLAGLVCGLLWEVWNYWAVAKRHYQLEFLGELQAWRYFEMPLLGMLGFLPFAPACWVAFQFLLGVLPNMGEELPDRHAIL